MALSSEDKKDVAASFGKKAASAVYKATRDGSGYDRAFAKKNSSKGKVGKGILHEEWVGHRQNFRAKHKKSIFSKEETKYPGTLGSFEKHVSSSKRLSKNAPGS